MYDVCLPSFLSFERAKKGCNELEMSEERQKNMPCGEKTLIKRPRNKKKYLCPT